MRKTLLMQPPLCEAAARASDLPAFLDQSLHYCTASLGCWGGSVFLYEGATAMLERRSTTYRDLQPFSLRPGEGVAGRAFTEGRTLRLPRAELERIFSPSPGWGWERFREIVAVPVLVDGRTEAVYCFDYAHDPSPRRVPALRRSESRDVDRVIAQLSNVAFSNALQRARSHQADLDLAFAGEGPSRLRHEVSRFLSAFRARFASPVGPAPDIACIQIADRRRGVIRTIQGFGLPLSFQNSATTLLDSQDILAVVLETAEIRIIAGNDKRHFNQEVYRAYGHDKLVRLWLPLFPFPLGAHSMAPGALPEATMAKDILTHLQWGNTEGDGNTYLCRTANWSDLKPPKTLVFGTLEVGFRSNPDALSLDPFAPDFVATCAARALDLVRPVFDATLAGSLEAIGRATASVARAKRVSIQVAVTDTQHLESRTYPTDSFWPAAIPTTIGVHPSPMAPPVRLAIDTEDAVPMDEARLDRLTTRVEDAIRLALRLDDYAIHPHAFIERVGERTAVGTRWPDERLASLCQTACRESGASRGVLRLFEWSPAQTGGPSTALEAIGDPIVWPDGIVTSTAIADMARARMVATTRIPAYPRTTEIPAVATAVIPLEMADGAVGVMDLAYSGPHVFDDEEQRRLEGLVTRWVSDLSLQRLVAMDQFSTLMRALRRKIVETRKKRTRGRDGTHQAGLVEALLPRLLAALADASGVLITLYSHSKTGISVARRFWALQSADQQPVPVDDHSVLGATSTGPCGVALSSGNLRIFGPGDPARNASAVDAELSAAAARLEADGNEERAVRIRRLIDLAVDTTNTLLVCPVCAPGSEVDAVIAVFLRGRHLLSFGRQRLVLELGELVRDALLEMRRLDTEALGKTWNEALEECRKGLGTLRAIDDVAPFVLDRLGSSSGQPGAAPTPKYFDVAERAALWLLAEDGSELVLHAVIGADLRELGDVELLATKQHPLLARQEVIQPKKRRPRLKEGFRLWTISLVESTGTLTRAYATATGLRWLVSWPLLDSDDSLLGVVDMLRETPLSPIEQSALESSLRRLSVKICLAFERGRLSQMIKAGRELTVGATAHLRAFHAQDVYTTLISGARQELGCAECDLYLYRDGELFLRATTRAQGPREEIERFDYWVQPKDDGTLVSRCALAKRGLLAHTSITPDPPGDVSPQLASLLMDDHTRERIAVPLVMEGSQECPVGVLSLSGPMARPPGAARTGRFTAQHLRLALDLGVVEQRVIQMAQLQEQQGWLVNELVHSLGQPLEALWDVIAEMAKALYWANQQDKALVLKEKARRAFEMVHEGRLQLGLYARMNQQQAEERPESVDLARLVQRCSELLEEEAACDGKKLDLSAVTAVRPVRAYEAWLRKAIFNLLQNAVKYSWKGKVITVELAETRAGEIRLSVCNYGIGIPPADVRRIFEPYFRSRVPDAKRIRQGTGIGLAVVREAIERLHKGKVLPVSEPPRRSQLGTTAEDIRNVPHKTTFTVTLWRGTLEGLAGGEEATK